MFADFNGRKLYWLNGELFLFNLKK
jgi:hypothetical protein